MLLIFGQSNSANYHGQGHTALDHRVVNYFGGRCYEAQSPLLGADGNGGEAWTQLANVLIERRAFDQVILVPIAIGATSVQQWAESRLNGMLADTLRSTPYQFTHLLWHQGESDAFAQRTAADYSKDFRTMLNTIRRLGVRAPIYVSRATYLGFDRRWQRDNPVALAQAALPDGNLIRRGPDTDYFLEPGARFDGAHFSATGQAKFVEQWLAVLLED